MPPAISGSGGHCATYLVARTLVKDFDLPEGQALKLLAEWNQTHADPPWPEADLRHKVQEAAKSTGARARLLKDKPGWNAPWPASSHPRQEPAGGWGGLVATSHSPPPLTGTRPVTSDEAQAIVQSRGLEMASVCFPAMHGMLRQVIGGAGDPPCWLVADGPEWPDMISRAEPPSPSHAYFAEARRLDRHAFQHGAKAHTWKGSRKDWLLGASFLRNPAWRFVLIVEGPPDWLAALQLADHLECHENLLPVLPLAICGKSISRFHSEALAGLKGRAVLVMPDNDDGTGGDEKTVIQWIKVFKAAGAAWVNPFTLDGYTKPDGSPAKDLNDVLADTGLTRNPAFLNDFIAALKIAHRSCH